MGQKTGIAPTSYRTQILRLTNPSLSHYTDRATADRMSLSVQALAAVSAISTRLQAITAVTVGSAVMWDVTPDIVAGSCRRFGVTSAHAYQATDISCSLPGTCDVRNSTYIQEPGSMQPVFSHTCRCDSGSEYKYCQLWNEKLQCVST